MASNCWTIVLDTRNGYEDARTYTDRAEADARIESLRQWLIHDFEIEDPNVTVSELWEATGEKACILEIPGRLFTFTKENE